MTIEKTTLIEERAVESLVIEMSVVFKVRQVLQNWITGIYFSSMTRLTKYEPLSHSNDNFFYSKKKSLSILKFDSIGRLVARYTSAAKKVLLSPFISQSAVLFEIPQIGNVPKPARYFVEMSHQEQLAAMQMVLNEFNPRSKDNTLVNDNHNVDENIKQEALKNDDFRSKLSYRL